MKHLFVTNDFPPKRGGIESYLVSMTRGMKPSDVVVMAPSREGYAEADAMLPYEVVRLPGSYLRARRAVADAIRDVVRTRNIDALTFLQTLPLGRLAPKFARELDIPVALCAHGAEILLPSKAPGVRRVIRTILTEVDLVSTASHFTADAVKRLTKGAANVSVVEPTVDVGRFAPDIDASEIRARHNLSPSDFVAVFVSRLVKRKGADVLIRAMRDVDGVALIAGSGPEASELRKLIDATGARAVLAGSVSEEELPKYYAAGDVFVMPCFDRYRGLETEGFGIVYIEAGACGKPSIAGTCGGSVEAVVHERTGLVLPDSTPTAVAAALNRYSDPALRAAHGSEGRRKAVEEHSPEAGARKLEAAIEAVRKR